MAQHILVLNGPNLNMLGSREPGIYGHQTLADINSHLSQLCADAGASFSAFQSNHEGDLVDRIQAARHDDTGFIIINAGAYTHTSVAIRDALAGTGLPFIEVHISNVHKREPFRHQSFLSDQAVGVVVGLGAFGYEAALRYALSHQPGGVRGVAQGAA